MPPVAEVVIEIAAEKLPDSVTDAESDLPMSFTFTDGVIRIEVGRVDIMRSIRIKA